MKTVGIVSLVVVVGVVMVILASALRIGCFAQEQAHQVIEKTLDADNIIYNYEYFRQANQDIQAQDKKIDTAKKAVENFLASAGPRKDWDFRDKEEQQRLQANVTGLENVLAEMKAQYNARANMANRKIFMGKDVPAQID